MDTRPIIQSFFGTPVRFYKTTFEVEMRSRNMTSRAKIGSRYVTQSLDKFTVETIAIPLPDFCSALGLKEHGLRQMIRLSEETFKDLYRTEQIPDALGRMRKTIILSQEMVDGLVFKLHTSRIKDPNTRVQVVDFQRWIMLTVGLIRRGKFKVTRDLAGAFKQAPPEYRDLLSLPSGRDLARMVHIQASAEGIRPETVYRKLRLIRGGNVVKESGEPRKKRVAYI